MIQVNCDTGHPTQSVHEFHECNSDERDGEHEHDAECFRGEMVELAPNYVPAVARLLQDGDDESDCCGACVQHIVAKWLANPTGELRLIPAANLTGKKYS